MNDEWATPAGFVRSTSICGQQDVDFDLGGIRNVTLADGVSSAVIDIAISDDS